MPKFCCSLLKYCFHSCVSGIVLCNFWLALLSCPFIFVLNFLKVSSFSVVNHIKFAMLLFHYMASFIIPFQMIGCINFEYNCAIIYFHGYFNINL